MSSRTFAVESAGSTSTSNCWIKSGSRSHSRAYLSLVLAMNHKVQAVSWPCFPIHITQHHANLAEVYLAHTSIVLPSGTRVVCPCFLIRTLIQKQHTPFRQLRPLTDLCLDLLIHPGSIPGRVGHEMLKRLPIMTTNLAPDPGKMPMGVHRQLASHVIIRTPTGIASFGEKTGAIAFPVCFQIIAQLGNLFSAKPPSRWITYIFFTILIPVLLSHFL